MSPYSITPYPAPSEHPHADGIHVLRRLLRRHHACIDGRIRETGIFPGQHRMLAYIARSEQLLSQCEIADALDISPAAVTASLQRLEKDGFVSRLPMDGDCRRKGISITEAGRAKLAEVREIVEEVDRALFAGLSPEELRTLSILILRMDANLDALGASPDGCCRPRCRGEGEHPAPMEGGEDA